MLHGFLPFSPASFTESCSFWYGLKDLFTLRKLADKVSLTVKTDDVTSGRGDVDPRAVKCASWTKGLRRVPIRILAFELKFICFIFSSYYVAQSESVMDVLSFTVSQVI